MIKKGSILSVLLASLLALSPASSLASSSLWLKQYAVAVPEVITSDGNTAAWGNEEDIIEKGISTENSENTTASPSEHSPTTSGNSNSANPQ